MTFFSPIRNTIAGIGMLALLSGCGGGDSPGNPNPSAEATNAFSSAYSGGLASLTSFAGLTSTALADVFDAAYLDSGSSKADVVAALQSEAQAVAVSPDFPSFAQLSLSNVSISNCDATTKICTLTATLTNSDVDTVSVPFTTQVKLSDKVRLYGDQSAS